MKSRLIRAFDAVYDEATRVAPALARQGKIEKACYTSGDGVWVDIPESKGFAYLEKEGVGVFIYPAGKRKKGGVRPLVVEVSAEISPIGSKQFGELNASLRSAAEGFSAEYGMDGLPEISYEAVLPGDDSSPIKMAIPEKTKYSGLAARGLLLALEDFSEGRGIKVGYDAISD